MRKGYLALLVSFISLLSCDKDQYAAAVPSFLRIDEVKLVTDLALEGTSSSKITTVWVEIDGEIHGVYELPAEVPVLAEGTHEVTILAGINENGNSSTRLPYPFFTDYTETITFEKEKVHYLNAATDSVPRVEYRSSTTIELIEDFEGVGSNLVPGSSSDTLLYTVQDSAVSFWVPGENGYRSGVAYMPKHAAIWEVTEQTGRDLSAGMPVFLEMNYKTDLPLVVGMYITTPSQIIQAQTAYINPSEDWNKIYINFFSEVTGYSTALEFKVFIGSLTNGSEEFQEVYIDNLKLVY